MASGPITRADIADFRQFATAQRLRESAIVFIGSPGGDLIAGIALGEEIRKRGFDTFVAGYDVAKGQFTTTDCASACFFMFLGGVRRGASEGSRLGVHQLVLNNPGTVEQSVMSAQWFMGQAARHVQDMGVDPAVTAMALSIPAHSLRWLSRKDLRSLGVITHDNGLQPGSLGALSFFDVARQP